MYSHVSGLSAPELTLYTVIFWLRPEPLCQAAAMTLLATMSTGMKSVTLEMSPYTDVNIPLASATKSPVGPLKLSIQPGKGSFAVAVMIDGRRITTGSEEACSCTSTSATALVNVYEFGRPSNKLGSRAASIASSIHSVISSSLDGLIKAGVTSSRSSFCWHWQ